MLYIFSISSSHSFSTYSYICKPLYLSLLYPYRHRKKKSITASNNSNEPKLTKHSYPQMNSPQPSCTHSTATSQGGMGPQKAGTSSPRHSSRHQHHHPAGIQYPHSPDLSQFAETGSPVVHHGYHQAYGNINTLVKN